MGSKGAAWPPTSTRALGTLHGSADRWGADIIGVESRPLCLGHGEDGSTVATRPACQPVDPGPMLEHARGDQRRGSALRADDLFAHAHSISRTGVAYQAYRGRMRPLPDDIRRSDPARGTTVGPPGAVRPIVVGRTACRAGAE